MISTQTSWNNSLAWNTSISNAPLDKIIITNPRATWFTNGIYINIIEINENAITEMCRLGYNRNFLIDCIEKNEINYATTGYYLLVKYCVSN